MELHKFTSSVNFLLYLLRIYWGGLIEGTTRLENGEKFQPDTFYNKKHLKYPLKEIKDAIIWNAIKYGQKNSEFFNACQTTYMFIGNFDTNVKDKHQTKTADMQEIIDSKRTFNYILNAFYCATNNNYCYVDASIKTYKHSVFDYRTDRLNPFRRLKLFKLKEFRRRMENNMTLNMALMHADMPYYFAKARELSEY